MKAVRSLPDTVPDDDRTLGWHVLEWASDYLLQPDGPNAGTPWLYTPEQARIVLRWYEIDELGRFVWRRGVLRRPKGWGKDPFLASLAAVELCGPCRFAGFDHDGRPVAVAHPAPWIQTAAVSKDQTRNTMTLFPGMLSPDAIAEYRIDIGKEIIYARAGTARLEAVTSSPRALEGGRPSLVIANETQHWLSNNDGLDMAEAIRRNLGKSRDGSARVMEITNAHLPGEGSAAEASYEAWRQGDQAGVYYDSIEAPPGIDIKDSAAVRDGLLVARGDSDWLDVDRLLAEIFDPITPEHISRRYYLNQIVAVETGTWITDEAWDACEDKEKTIPDGSLVTLGFDGSYNGDSTGLVVVSCEEIPHSDVWACWEKPVDSIDPDWQVPIEEVEDSIREACKKWKVAEVPSDPYRWARSIQILTRERVKMVEFPQTRARMTPAITMFFEAVMNGTMTHSGDPRLRRHIMNARIKQDSRGSALQKDSKGSLRKIDLAVCDVIAFNRARGRKSVKRVFNMAELLAQAEE